MTDFTPRLRDDAALLHPPAYPRIARLEDIAPHVAGNRAIRTFADGPLTTMRYMVNDPSVFQTPWDLEARGLVFDTASGAILSRPFHKFFTVANAESAAALLEGGPVSLFEKHDGSMLGSFMWQGVPRVHTKGGFTGHALTAQERLTRGPAALIAEADSLGVTPIFEWVAPDNRIVLDYAEEDFILLAVRHRVTGEYDEAMAADLAARHGVRRPAVLAVVSTVEDLVEWVGRIAALTGTEGAVAAGPSGWRGKMKTRAYLAVHKAMSMLSIERHAFSAIVNEMDDDIVPLLTPEQGAFLAAYGRALRERMLEVCAAAEAMAADLADLPRGEAAARIQAGIEPDMRPLVFAALGGKPGMETLAGALKRRSGSQAAVEAARAAFGLPAWTPPPGLFLKD